MRKTSKWMLAAAMTAGLAGYVPAFVSAADKSDAKTEARADNALTLPAGFDVKDVGAVSEAKSGLVKLAERSVTKGDFEKFLRELAKPDQERTQQFKDFDQKKLDGRIDQIAKAWKAKYGKDFDLNDKNVVFDERFTVAQGEVSDPNVALANWPVNATGGEAVTASNKESANRDTKQEKHEASAEKLEKGRNVAIVHFPAAYGFNAMNVSMIHQLPAFYCVDIPNSRTGEQVYNDLLNHLTYIGEHVDQWPADVNDAYRMVAYHAVASVYGVDIPSGKAG